MLRAAILVLALLAGLSGCGAADDSAPADGPLSKTEYVKRFNAAVKTAAATAASAQTTTKSPVRQLQEAQQAVDGLIRDVSALQAPAEARKAQDDFLAGLRGLSRAQRPAIAAEAEGRQDEVARVLGAEAPKSVRDNLESARRFFERNDYDIDIQQLPGS